MDNQNQSPSSPSTTPEAKASGVPVPAEPTNEELVEFLSALPVAPKKTPKPPPDDLTEEQRKEFLSQIEALPKVPPDPLLATPAPAAERSAVVSGAPLPAQESDPELDKLVAEALAVREVQDEEDRKDPKKRTAAQVALAGALLNGGDLALQRLKLAEAGDFKDLLPLHALQSLADIAILHVKKHGSMPQEWWLLDSVDQAEGWDDTDRKLAWDAVVSWGKSTEKPEVLFAAQFDEIDAHLKKQIYRPMVWDKATIEAYQSGNLAKLDAILNRIIERRSATGSTQGRKFQPVAMKDFIANAPPLRWMIEGLMTLNSTTLLAGMMKGGKSMFAQNLALQAARGEDFGCLKMKDKFGVLYLTAEDDASVFKTRYGDQSIPENLFAQYRPPVDLYTGANVPELVAFMKEKGLKLLVIDSLNRFHSAESENDAIQMTTVMNRCDEIAQAADGTVLAIHHWSKNKDADGMTRARGSSVITSIPRCILNWGHVDDVTSSISVNGNSTTVDDLTVRWDRGTGKVSVEEGKAVKEEVKAKRNKALESMMKLCVLKPEGVGADEIKKESQLTESEHTIRNWMEDMASDVHKLCTLVVGTRGKKLFKPRIEGA